jgi:hypothetical protein
MKIHKIAQDSTEPVKLDISAEEKIVDRYANLLPKMEDEARGAKGDKEEAEKVAKKIDMIIDEVNTIRKQVEDKKTKDKMGSLLVGYKRLKGLLGVSTTKTASVLSLDQDAAEELLYTYGEKVCQAVKQYHPASICFVDCDKDGGEVIVREMPENFDGDDAECYRDILRVRVNEKFVVDSIIPCGDLAEIYPIYSVEFYQKYWKPIVESIGHFHIEDASMLILPTKAKLPDIPKGDETYTIEGWGTEDGQPETVDISFRGSKPIWIFEASKTTKTAGVQSKYTEQDYLNALVQCIDPELESINGRTGAVIQVIPASDFVELDVDFGRGLGVVRLTERQVEIVNEV